MTKTFIIGWLRALWDNDNNQADLLWEFLPVKDTKKIYKAEMTE